MAKMTRSQRRARRQAQAESAGQAGATSRAAQVRPAAAPAKTQTGARRKEDRGSKRFVAESWGELKKVEWPTQSHVIQGTLVVIIACVIVGTYIWVADIAFRNLVQDIFLR
ncbi:MAG: preprotein translocase subunit SecE [Gaiellaceae bacterium]